MKTQYEIRNPRLDGIFISFDTEWEAMRYWRENVERAPETNLIHGAVVVRHSWEPKHEAETARLNWLLGPGSIARFMEECERAPRDYSNPDTWLTNARTAIDICRRAPPSTATVIWPNIEDDQRRSHLSSLAGAAPGGVWSGAWFASEKAAHAWVRKLDQMNNDQLADVLGFILCKLCKR